MIKAFVYVEAQASAPFEKSPWEKGNAGTREPHGCIGKPWFSDANNNSIGGFYVSDSIENAKRRRQNGSVPGCLTDL